MKLSEIRKFYGKEEILKGVDLTIEPGSLTALIGPNGAGKSTILALMSRLLSKDSGHLYIKGQEIESWNSKELAKELSMLKQSQHFQARLTVQELISFGRFPYRNNDRRLSEEDKLKIDEAIHYMQLEEFKDRYINSLSGGQLQRVFIAMVLAQDTDFILLDEPLNNLDIRQSLSMMVILRDLVDKLGKTVVIVIHDVNMASQFADCMIAIKDGQVYRTGKVEEIMTEELLGDLFDMTVSLAQINGKSICLYKTSDLS